MNAELEDKISDAFSFMQKKKSFEEQCATGIIDDNYGAFGCEVSDGWYDVIYGLCAEITELYKKQGQPIDIVVDQIKEKYGTLRFYYHHEGEDKGNTIDCPGVSLRFLPNDSELHRQVVEIVHKWEKKSGEVCEKCGKPGVLRNDLSWILTLCDDCYDKIQPKKR